MEVADAYDLIARAVDAGRTAHGYLVCGDLRGACDALVARVLAKLFPDAPAQIASRSHPDVAYLEPEGKSRTIHAQSMRERIVEPMSTTSFAGGWKVGVVVGADRMETVAANAFLKTLEEPPPQTVIILITEQPSRLLTTILSRCVRVPLHEAGNALHLSEAQQAFLPAVTAALPLIGSDVAALALRADFQALLAERKEQITKRLTAAIKAEAKAIAEGTDIRDWEARQKDATAALIETEYLAEREQMLELLSLCLGQAVLLASHAPDVQPLAPEITALSTARPVADLLRRMRALEALHTDLNFNVNEALILDSHLLNIIGNNTL